MISIQTKETKLILQQRHSSCRPQHCTHTQSTELRVPYSISMCESIISDLCHWNTISHVVPNHFYLLRLISLLSLFFSLRSSVYGEPIIFGGSKRIWTKSSDCRIQSSQEKKQQQLFAIDPHTEKKRSTKKIIHTHYILCYFFLSVVFFKHEHAISFSSFHTMRKHACTLHKRFLDVWLQNRVSI